MICFYLVEIVKNYVKYKRETLEAVINFSNKVTLSKSIDDSVSDDNELEKC